MGDEGAHFLGCADLLQLRADRRLLRGRAAGVKRSGRRIRPHQGVKRALGGKIICHPNHLALSMRCRARRYPRHLRGSERMDHAAGDLLTGISGRLGAEIVRLAMDDHGAADHIGHAEPVGQNGQKGAVAARKQGRQIACMRGMGTVLRIVVPAGLREILTRAGAAFMNVQGENTGGAGRVPVRQAADLRDDDDAGRHDWADARIG